MTSLRVDLITGEYLYGAYRDKLRAQGLDSDTWEECEEYYKKTWIALAADLMLWKDGVYD